MPTSGIQFFKDIDSRYRLPFDFAQDVGSRMTPSMIAFYRIYAFFLRHLYPLKRDLDLLSDMVYWPLIDTLLWGITGQWLTETSGSAYLVVVILMALIMWYMIWRSQSEVSRNLMDEIWNNNLVNLFSTPLTITEWVIGVLCLSVLKTLATILMMAPVIWLLYSVSVLQLGPWLLLFFVMMTMTGWWIGFIGAGIVLRFGPKMQNVIWTLPGILIPLSAVYYPLEKLPFFIQPISRLIPATYAFETMRDILLSQPIDWNLLFLGNALNIIYLSFTTWFFIKSFYKSQELGLGRFN